MRWFAAHSKKIPLLILAVCLLGAIFFRFYNFSDTLLFQGDQGRDALIVADIFRKGDLVFIGPVTSIGNMYLGPFYYYFMLPFLMASYPSPLGPAIAIALSSVLATFLIYKLGKEIVGERGALIAAFCFAFCAEIVRYARFSWNPNLSPLLSLLLFWCTYRAWRVNSWYWLAVSLCFSLLMQLHYMTLLVGGGFGIIWLIQLATLIRRKKSQEIRKLLLASLGGVIIFFASLTPLALFDIKHDGINRKGLSSLFNQEQAFNPHENPDSAGKLMEFGKDFRTRSGQVLFDNILTREHPTKVLLLILLTFAMILAIRKKVTGPFIILTAFMLTSLIGMSLYQASLFVHYVIYLYPIVFLWYGWLLAQASRKPWGKAFMVAFIILFLSFNIPKMPLHGNGWGIEQMNALSQDLVTHLRPDEKYNIVLVSPTKDIYGPHYRYFLSTTDHPSLPAELGPEAETLVVINEAAEPDITTLPIYEIVIFPVKIPSEVYTIPNGPEISIFRKTP